MGPLAKARESARSTPSCLTALAPEEAFSAGDVLRREPRPRLPLSEARTLSEGAHATGIGAYFCAGLRVVAGVTPPAFYFCATFGQPLANVSPACAVTLFFRGLPEEYPRNTRASPTRTGAALRCSRSSSKAADVGGCRREGQFSLTSWRPSLLTRSRTAPCAAKR